jgi:hypothetical protein
MEPPPPPKETRESRLLPATRKRDDSIPGLARKGKTLPASCLLPKAEPIF